MLEDAVGIKSSAQRNAVREPAGERPPVRPIRMSASSPPTTSIPTAIFPNVWMRERSAPSCDRLRDDHEEQDQGDVSVADPVVHLVERHPRRRTVTATFGREDEADEDQRREASGASWPARQAATTSTSVRSTSQSI